MEFLIHIKFSRLLSLLKAGDFSLGSLSISKQVANTIEDQGKVNSAVAMFLEDDRAKSSAMVVSSPLAIKLKFMILYICHCLL